MRLILFHRIGNDGADSAEVRRFIVQNGLEDLVEFKNLDYESARTDLLELTGTVEAPVFIAEAKILRGKAAIIDWLKTNILCLRD